MILRAPLREVVQAAGADPEAATEALRARMDATPWYVDAMIGVGAWVSGILLLVAAGIAGFLSTDVYVVIGLAALGVAVFLRRTGDGVFRAQIAVSAGQPVGAAVYSPIYSTTRARPGVYVSDLWVAAAARGGGLGAKLLAAVRDDARARWGAGFVRLVVYADNPRALGFYTRLGFALRSDEAGMLLEGAALERLGGSR